MYTKKPFPTQGKGFFAVMHQTTNPQWYKTNKLTVQSGLLIYEENPFEAQQFG